MLYSVGDIHGRFDLLKTLHEKIMEDSKKYDEINTIVFVGDYIDRGPQSKEVIDFLRVKPFDEFNHVFLRGNHEDMMIKSLYGTEENVIYDIYDQKIRVARDIFLGNGGDATLKSFGVNDPSILLNDKDSLDDIFAPYKSFFDKLLYFYDNYGYYFVHAGVVPGIPLDRQDHNAIMWIRDKFLNNETYHGRMIIHGHTSTPSRTGKVAPEIKENRINLDTGAYYTNVLTAVCLDEAHILKPYFLCT